MGSLVFVWPVSASARNAAAVRLSGFVRAAVRMGVPTCTIVPGRATHSLPDDRFASVQLPLYGCSADNGTGFLRDVLRLLPSTIQLLRVLKEQGAECVMTSTPAPFVSTQSMVAAGVLGIPYVLDVRDSWEMEAITHRGRLRNSVKGWLERLCSGSAAAVFCVTSTLRDRLIAKYNLRRATTQIVANGADLSLFNPGPDPRDLDFVFLGSPAKYRNVAGVLEGLANVQELSGKITACFVGWGDAPESDVIRALARAKDLSEGVRFIGSLPHEEIARLLRRARLGIVSLSGEEVFRQAVGAKTYEYIACGVPLACLGPSGGSELRQFVESESLGFFASDSKEFAKQAIAILTDDDRWARVSRNCIAAAARFDRRLLSEKALRDFVIPLMKTQPAPGGLSRS